MLRFLKELLNGDCMKLLSTIAATLILFSANVFASELECVISINLEPVSYMNVTTEIGKKVLIDSGEGITAYVTQKDESFYSLEVFLADYEMRGYSEGSLSKTNDKLNFSIWDRARILDVSCTLAKK